MGQQQIGRRVVAAVAVAVAGLAAAQGRAAVQVVMTGLNNPYQLAFGPNGGMYVAEAGVGSNGITTAPALVGSNGTQEFYGLTGSVSQLLGGTQSRVITGLPSFSPATVTESTGLQGLAFDASGNLYGTFGFIGTEAQRNQLVAGSAGATAGEFAQVVRLNTATNTVTPVSDLLPYETTNYATNNPGGSTPEGNPYAMAALPSGGFAVTDGGGNVVFRVPAGGGAATLLKAVTALPNSTGVGGPTYQSVPTGVTVHNGTLYVGEFTGFPFPAGGANVLGIDPTTGATVTTVSGLTTVTGLTFGPDGALYVLDDTTNGLATGSPGPAELFRVNPSTEVPSLVTTFADPGSYTGLTTGPDGALYLSYQGTGAAGTGEVLRYSLSAVPEPATAGLLAVAVGGGLLGRRRRSA